ncbi:MAG: hypothetical protein AAFY26_09000 [Cyanobacteria bacterium J06638_22]
MSGGDRCGDKRWQRSDGTGCITLTGDRPDLQRLNIACRYTLRDALPGERLLLSCAV